MDVKVRAVPDTLDVIQRDSVGAVRRMLEVALSNMFTDASVVRYPAFERVIAPVVGAAK